MDYNKRNKVYRLINSIGTIADIDEVLEKTHELNKEMLNNKISGTEEEFTEAEIEEMMIRYDEMPKEVSKSIDSGELMDLLSGLYYDK